MEDNGSYANAPEGYPPPPPPGYTAPPQPQYQATPTAPAAPPKRKHTGRNIFLGVLAFILIVVVAGVAFLFGRATQQRDLGVVATQADFDSAVAKIGLEFPKDPPDGDWENYERVYTGEKPLDVVLSQSEVSALMSFNHGSGYWPIKSMQVKLLGGNQAEASALVTYAGRDWPVYVSGSADLMGNTLSSSIRSAEAAGIEAPEQYLGPGSDFLNRIVNDRLSRIPGFNIESFEVDGDQIHAIGTIWEKAEWVLKQ
ncbi:MAG: hypothetical protein JXR33_09570 [Coriobacteriia bacterium]|nr:hypothetical protein [Coriobacteriia bacterium]